MGGFGISVPIPAINIAKAARILFKDISLYFPFPLPADDPPPSHGFAFNIAMDRVSLRSLSMAPISSKVPI